MPAPKIENIVARLASIEADAPVVLTCYLRLDVAFRQRKLYLAVLKERLRVLQSQLEPRGLGRGEVAEVRADAARVLEWAGHPGNLPGLPGVAVFACQRLRLFEVVPLPRVHRTRAEVDRRPLLHELFDARERLDHYLAVLVDRERARFFEVAADGATEVIGVITKDRRGGRFRSDRRDAPGWGERHYHNRMTSQKHRHYAEVADATAALLRTRRLAGVAVMGPSVHAKALTDFLPDEIRDRLLGTASLNPTTANPAEVAQATWLLQADSERAQEASLVEEIVRGAAKGAAVNGLRPTLAALARGQVRTLAVPEGQDASGFRCSGSGRLVPHRAQCRGDGEALPVANLVDAAIDEALRQRAEVRVINERRQADRIEGLAATLRFRDR